MKRIAFFVVSIFIGLIFFSCGQNNTEPLAENSDQVSTIQNELQDDFKVYQNPNQAKITVWHYSYDDIKGRLHVYYSDGRLLLQKDVTIDKRINTWEIDIPKDAYGLLVIKLITPKIIRTSKIFKKRLV